MNARSYIPVFAAAAVAASAAGCGNSQQTPVFECNQEGRSAAVYGSSGVFTLKTREEVAGKIQEQTPEFFGNAADAQSKAEAFCL